jgi:hypothetical protein
VVKISAGIVFLLAGLAGIVLGVIGWTKGRCDTRALKIVPLSRSCSRSWRSPMHGRS